LINTKEFFQLRTTSDNNRTTVESLELKLRNGRAEYEVLKTSHVATLAEFESYKVRATLNENIDMAQ